MLLNTGVSLLYGFGQARYASVSLFAEHGYLYICVCTLLLSVIIHLFHPFDFVAFSTNLKLQIKMRPTHQYTAK